MAKKLNITDEQLAKVIAVALMGYAASIEGREISNETVRGIYQDTLESINEDIPGELSFIEDFVYIYDNDLDSMKEAAMEIRSKFAE
jgi:hypothetical protein